MNESLGIVAEALVSQPSAVGKPLCAGSSMKLTD